LIKKERLIKTTLIIEKPKKSFAWLRRQAEGLIKQGTKDTPVHQQFDIMEFIHELNVYQTVLNTRTDRISKKNLLVGLQYRFGYLAKKSGIIRQTLY
jgi:hypothetical protein